MILLALAKRICFQVLFIKYEKLYHLKVKFIMIQCTLLKKTIDYLLCTFSDEKYNVSLKADENSPPSYILQTFKNNGLF